MKKPRELPSQQDLLKLFYYDNGLKWKEGRKGSKLCNKDGDVVGCVGNEGYAMINVFGVTYMLSRIVYQTVNGNLTTDLVIDHLNRDRKDNRIENLRAITEKNNLRSKTMYSNNSTGVTGVSSQAYKYMKKDGTEVEHQYYTAHWQDPSGKTRLKCFSISKYGKEEAFHLACEYRQAMIESLKNSGEWYDETHGSMKC